MSLAPNKALFGALTNIIINELHSIKFIQNQVNYCDMKAEQIDQTRQLSNQPNDLPLPKPFGPFYRPGEYNGICMNTQRLKFFQAMQRNESFIQARFQLNHNKGASGNHTHKYAKLMNAHGRNGKFFSATYTFLSQLGFVISCRPTYTKSNDEIRPILLGLKKNCENSGVGKLKRYETDNINGDGKLWKEIFPELNEGVVELFEIDKSLEMLKLMMTRLCALKISTWPICGLLRS